MEVASDNGSIPSSLRSLSTAILQYCLRVFDQSRLIPPAASYGTLHPQALLDSPFHAHRLALVEAVLLVESLCVRVPSLVLGFTYHPYPHSQIKEVFAPLHKLATSPIFTRPLPMNADSSLTSPLSHTTRARGALKLALLEFFVKHGKAVVYNPEPIIRDFMESFLGSTCTHSSAPSFSVIFLFLLVAALTHSHALLIQR